VISTTHLYQILEKVQYCSYALVVGDHIHIQTNLQPSTRGIRYPPEERLHSLDWLRGVAYAEGATARGILLLFVWSRVKAFALVRSRSSCYN